MSGFRAFSEQSLAGKQPDEVVMLDKSEAHHLGKVLRARTGDAVTMFDALGHAWDAELVELSTRQGKVRLRSAVAVEAFPVSIELGIVWLKGKSMDAVIRRATELGVSTIMPLVSEHGEVRLERADSTSKLQKWRTDSIEACKQSGRLSLPAFHEPQALTAFLQTLPSPTAGGLRLIASLEDSAAPLWETLSQTDRKPEQVRLLIGPEGDFSPAEYTLAREAGFTSVSLGKRVLRSEVAVTYALSVLDAWANA